MPEHSLADFVLALTIVTAAAWLGYNILPDLIGAYW